MNLQKKCRKCHDFFPAKPMELQFFCNKPECQKYRNTHNFWSIKSQRYICMDYFDIYDLDRPYNITENGEILNYERVCRVCGMSMFNKNGKYSVHRRYCQKHTGNELWSKYNWSEVSKKYARKVAKDNEELIERTNNTDYSSVTICEECSKICSIYDIYSSEYWHKKRIDVINIHHIFPVHKITMENIHLIWDFSNFKALCKECHNKQNHYLKRIEKVKFRMITSF
ncbi:hypothetical protein LCGC14_0987850 [marine sediment metagenome]|uniref:HNH domain-containing protein n=1 Tax=marine sediment metagenome TaxID=412755 RepID=A0A0F9QQ57_9ZZZZ